MTEDDRNFLLSDGLVPAMNAQAERRAIRYRELDVIRLGLTRLLELRAWPLKDQTYLQRMLSLSGASPSNRILTHDEVVDLLDFIKDVSLDAPTDAGNESVEPAGEQSPGDKPELERILASSSTLLSVSFLQRGIEVSSGVLLVVARRDHHRWLGTAFRVGPRHVLTNHHVVEDQQFGRAESIDLVPHYQQAWGGDYRHYSDFEHIKALGKVVAEEKADDPAARDWALIELPQDLPKEIFTISLSTASVPQVDGRAYIIQHPAGQPKQVGLNRNLIKHVDEHIIKYLTDTEGGSSGSPIFDDQWRLIGIHHAAERRCRIPGFSTTTAECASNRLFRSCLSSASI